MRKLVGTVAALAVVGAGAAAAIGFGGADAGTADAGPLPPATAPVTRQTLIDAETVSGVLGYGDQTTVSARRSGTLTWLAPTGATVKRGGALYRVDDDPVVLLTGALPAYREIGPGDSGADVKQFERNLSGLGYDGFTVDDEYTWATADAVERWQDDLGRPVTGRIGPDQVFYAPGTVRVHAASAAVGDLLQPGKGVLAVTGTTRLVTVELDIDDQRLAEKDAVVRVSVPGGDATTGKIVSAETVIESGDSGAAGGAGGTESETKLEVTVSVDDPATLDGLDEASVDVEFTAAEREGVLTVPVAALLALAEGGYGVEIVDGADSRIVAVRTGLFADGRVEVAGDGLAEGVTVGVPS